MPVVSCLRQGGTESRSRSGRPERRSEGAKERSERRRTTDRNDRPNERTNGGHRQYNMSTEKEAAGPKSFHAAAAAAAAASPPSFSSFSSFPPLAPLLPPPASSLVRSIHLHVQQHWTEELPLASLYFTLLYSSILRHATCVRECVCECCWGMLFPLQLLSFPLYIVRTYVGTDGCV